VFQDIAMNQITLPLSDRTFSPDQFIRSKAHSHPIKSPVFDEVIDLQDMVAFPLTIAYPPASDVDIMQAVEEAIACERNRLARDLHDAVSQTLYAASLIAEVLPDLWDIDETKARKSSEELRQLTRGALAEMRTLLFELRPAALNQASLPDLIKQISEAFAGRERLPIHLDLIGACEIPCDIKIEIYRIVQESLNNIVKHAHATRVELTLRLEADRVYLKIRDDGIGFDPTSVKTTSLGLRIMQERAYSIQAYLQVASQPGEGTTVTLEWHL
jgi:signal transduction histidine kinase